MTVKRGPSKLFGKLFLGNVVLLAFVLVACTWFILREVDQAYRAELTDTLRSRADLILQMVEDRFDLAHQSELDALVEDLAATQASRITLILADGTVLAESDGYAPDIASHADRPEFRQAMAGGWGRHTRFSDTVARDLKYVAIRAGPAERPLGVVRVAMPLKTITERIQSTRRLGWMVALVTFLAAVLFALGLAQVWSKPIRRITETARSLSLGDLSARATVTGTDELAVLAYSLNQMRDHLATQLATIDRHRRTLAALLAQLQEGVVVAGSDGRLVLLNPTAVHLLGLPEGAETDFIGRPVEECISQHDLQMMLLTGDHDAGQEGGEEHGDDADGVAIHETRLQVEKASGPVSLLARVSEIVLPGFTHSPGVSGSGSRPVKGRLLVLTDVTQLAQMMQMKADFAANASHELRTPLSAIRAAVETLRSLDPTTASASIDQWVGVIDRQSGRLEAMVKDLLDLSRVESASARFQPSAVRLTTVLAELRDRFAEALETRRLHWEVDRPDDLDQVRINPYLLGLVLDNLVDNAIKFTAAGGHIRIGCRRSGEAGANGAGLVIEITDDGCGIPAEEQERVFERFYQVERARSGTVRGTGLGLSIVRHAVSAMRGTVHLRSRVGEGTTVRVTLPQAD